MILISTHNGVFSWDEVNHSLTDYGLNGMSIHQVSAAEGTRVYALDKLGQLWEKNDTAPWHSCSGDSINEPISVIFVHPINKDIYVGTEPPRLYKHNNDQWDLVADLSELDVAKDWYTPYGAPPALRSIAAVTEDTLYLNVHVGGILRSTDRGKSWCPTNDGLDWDVHQVVVCPQSLNSLYAATATGFALSDDEASSWTVRNEGLKHRYMRGIAVHPEQPDVVLISGSSFMPDDWDAKGKWFSLYRTSNCGKNWEHVTSGFPDGVNCEIDTFGITFSRIIPDHVLCGISSGELYFSDNSGLSWSIIDGNLPKISSLCAV